MLPTMKGLLNLSNAQRAGNSAIPKQKSVVCSRLTTQHRVCLPPTRAVTSERPADTLASPWNTCLSVLDRISSATQGIDRKRTSDDEHSRVIDLLDDLYEELEETFYSKRGYIIPERERTLVDATGGSAVYGEVMPEGIQKFVQKLDLGPDSVFVDLGSGLGRVVLQVAMTTSVQKSIALELSRSRNEQAEWVLEKLQQQHGYSLDNVEIRTADITSCSYEGGTHFMLCSTAFSASGCKMIAERLASTSSFRVLVTSRQLPPTPYLRKVGEFACAYSWNLGGVAYVYTRYDLMSVPATCLTEFLSDDGLCWLPHDRTFHVPIVAEDCRPLLRGKS